MNALHDVEAERRAVCAIDDINAQQRQWRQRDNRRPRALSPREALAAVRFEALLLWVAWGNLRAGVELTAEDRERCTLAMNCIEQLTDEAVG